jgi:YfiH family protein
VRPRQVHGTRVARLLPALHDLGDADGVVSDRPGVPIGIVTADCLPILLATPSGAVAAVHAGWRGLAAGVIDAALESLAAIAPDAARAVAVIGPHVAPDCYEVDAVVVDALASRFGDALARALAPTRPGHWTLDLALLARHDLLRAGLADACVAALPRACTACDAARFHSYRRDGPGAGRLIHWLAASEPSRDALDMPGRSS